MQKNNKSGREQALFHTTVTVIVTAVAQRAEDRHMKAEAIITNTHKALCAFAMCHLVCLPDGDYISYW